MIREVKNHHAPSETPETWDVSEEEMQNAWDKKSEQFQYFKELFKKK